MAETELQNVKKACNPDQRTVPAALENSLRLNLVLPKVALLYIELI